MRARFILNDLQYEVAYLSKQLEQAMKEIRAAMNDDE